MRWTIRTARNVVGLTDPYFEVNSVERLEFAMAVCKDKIIEARRAGNDDAAADFSRAKAFFKDRYRRRISRVCECGDIKNEFAMHCQRCYLRLRFYRNNVMDKTIKEHEIEIDLVPVNPIKHKGDLASVIDRLAKSGQIGDSFVTSKKNTTVTTLARMRGMKVICRLIDPNENLKDPKKQRRYRVWRCDGLDMDEVNEIIRKRLAGEDVPPAKPCVPPTEEELEKLKRAKWGDRVFTGGRPENKRRNDAAA